jgi:hypothetical protein
MDVIGRQEAKTQGLRFYFTGKPCKRGHVSKRSVNSCRCMRCAADDQETWRQTNPEQAKQQMQDYIARDPEGWRARAKAWRENNPERAKERVRAWHAANPDYAKQWSRDNAGRVNATARTWYRANTAHRRALDRAWRKANPEAALAIIHRYRARAVAAPGTFTKDDIEDLLERQHYRCANPHCRADILRRFHIDHIIPLSREGTSNWPANLQLLCHPCNAGKGDKTMDEWLKAG